MAVAIFNDVGRAGARAAGAGAATCDRELERGRELPGALSWAMLVDSFVAVVFCNDDGRDGARAVASFASRFCAALSLDRIFFRLLCV